LIVLGISTDENKKYIFSVQDKATGRREILRRR
jgi:hypothetical protein